MQGLTQADLFEVEVHPRSATTQAHRRYLAMFGGKAGSQLSTGHDSQVRGKMDLADKITCTAPNCLKCIIVSIVDSWGPRNIQNKGHNSGIAYVWGAQN